MSSNEQTLVKEYKGKWYVFENINAESWGWDKWKDEPAPNILSIKTADGVFDTKEEAFKFARYLDARSGEWGAGTEYGVCERLSKDGAEVILTED